MTLQRDMDILFSLNQVSICCVLPEKGKEKEINLVSKQTIPGIVYYHWGHRIT